MCMQPRRGGGERSWTECHAGFVMMFGGVMGVLLLPCADECWTFCLAEWVPVSRLARMTVTAIVAVVVFSLVMLTEPVLQRRCRRSLVRFVLLSDVGLIIDAAIWYSYLSRHPY